MGGSLRDKGWLFLEALGLGKPLVHRNLDGERSGLRRIHWLGSPSHLTEEHGEEGRAELGGLESLLHEAVGELGLVGETAGGENVAHLLKEDLGTASLDLRGSRNDSPANAGVCELLKVLDLVDVAAAHEGGRHSLASRAAGAADTVDVVLGIVRKVVIDHDLKIVDVDAARGDIGGDKELELGVLELVHHAGALGLGDAAVETVGRESLGEQRVSELVDHALSVAEDDAETEPVEVDQTDERLGLPARGNLVIPLVDRGGGDILALDRHGLRIAGVAVDQLLDLTREGGREEDGLALLGGGVEDLLDVVAEAHVEHPVGLVEDRHLELVELEGSPLQVIDNATGGSDDDLDTLL